MNDIMRNHLGNLSRSVGTEYSGNRYEYILNQNDMYSALNEGHHTEDYKLKKQTGRHRYLLMNDVELLDVVNRIISDSVYQTGNEITNIVASDTVDMISSMIDGAIGGASRSKMSSKKFDLASELGKAIVTNTIKTAEAIHRENQRV